MTTTLEQINLFNLRYNISGGTTNNKYVQCQRSLATAATKPSGIKYKSVNQLLKESPLIGTTKFGLNFIA